MVSIVQTNNSTMVVFEKPTAKELNLLNECRMLVGDNRKTVSTQGKAKYDAFWDLELPKEKEQEMIAEQITLDIE